MTVVESLPLDTFAGRRERISLREEHYVEMMQVLTLALLKLHSAGEEELVERLALVKVRLDRRARTRLISTQPSGTCEEQG